MYMSCIADITLYHIDFEYLVLQILRQNVTAFYGLRENPVNRKAAVGENKCISQSPSTRLNRHHIPRLGYFSLMSILTGPQAQQDGYHFKTFVIFLQIHVLCIIISATTGKLPHIICFVGTLQFNNAILHIDMGNRLTFGGLCGLSV
jgi:hypothetical protein